MRTLTLALLTFAALGADVRTARADARPVVAQRASEFEITKSTHKTMVMQAKVFATRHADSLDSAAQAKTSAERYERLRGEAADKPEHAAVFHELALKERSSEKGHRDYAVIVKNAEIAHRAEIRRLAAKMDSLSIR